MARLEVAREFVTLLREKKKLWLIPIAVVLLLLATIVVLSANSALAPLIYTIF